MPAWFRQAGKFFFESNLRPTALPARRLDSITTAWQTLGLIAKADQSIQSHTFDQILASNLRIHWAGPFKSRAVTEINYSIDCP